MDDRVSLITIALSGRGEVETIKDLDGNDAQSFIDNVDEVRPRTSAVGYFPTLPQTHQTGIGSLCAAASEEVSKHLAQDMRP